MMSVRRATSEEWQRYYAETAKRGQHGHKDPIRLERARAMVRERLGVLAGLTALAGTLVAYFLLLAR